MAAFIAWTARSAINVIEAMRVPSLTGGLRAKKPMGDYISSFSSRSAITAQKM